MNRTLWIYLIVSLMLQGTVGIAQANDQIAEAQGKVEIRRNNRSFWGTVGTVLQYGDLLRPEQKARIMVLCSNNTRWRVPTGRLSGLGNGCPIGNARNVRGRGEDDFLAFLTQRFVYDTQLLSSSPLLRWNPLPNFSRYEVQIMQGEKVIWQQQVDHPEVLYTGSALQPGIDYSMKVFAMPQTAAPIATLSFQVLDPEQMKALQAAIAQLPKDLNPEAKAIALTRLYRSAGTPSSSSERLRPGLVMEAIAALEPLIAANNRTAYVHRLLGDLYLQVGLFNQAEAYYQRAIALSDASENTPERAAAQVGMANISAAKRKLSEATTWLKLAKFNYRLTGRSDRTELIDQWLARINLLR